MKKCPTWKLFNFSRSTTLMACKNWFDQRLKSYFENKWRVMGVFARYQWPSMLVTIKGFSRSATLVCLNTVCMNREWWQRMLQSFISKAQQVKVFCPMYLVVMKSETCTRAVLCILYPIASAGMLSPFNPLKKFHSVPILSLNYVDADLLFVLLPV